MVTASPKNNQKLKSLVRL